MEKFRDIMPALDGYYWYQQAEDSDWEIVMVSNQRIFHIKTDDFHYVDDTKGVFFGPLQPHHKNVHKEYAGDGKIYILPKGTKLF